MRRFLFAAACAVAVVGCSVPVPAPTPSDSRVLQQAPELPPVQTPPEKEGPPSEKRLFKLSDFAKVDLKIGPTTIRAWVADDDLKRSEGMMWLTDADVGRDEGMLFVFPTAEERGFWMANTLMALDIIYLDEAGKVVSIGQGKPGEETTVPSNGPAKYVLELKAGRSSGLGLKPGRSISIPTSVESKLG